MECQNELPAFLMNSSQNKSDFITRKPLLLLRQLKKCNEEERCATNKTLNKLRSKFPAELKFGASLKTDDSFFDAVAQGLNDLRAKGSITRRKPFHVTSLRLYQIDCDGIRVEDNEAHVGIPLIEGRVICQKFNIRIILRELLPISNVNEICTRVSKETSVGDSSNVVYIVKHAGHYVPLLSSLQKDIKVRMKVPRREVYGRSSDLKSFEASSTFMPLCAIENSPDGSRERLNGSTESIAENSRNHSIAFNAKNGSHDSNMFQRDSHNVVVAGQRNVNHRKARKRKKESVLCDEPENKKDSCGRGQSNPDFDIATKRKKTKPVERLVETIIISDERETMKDSCEKGQTNPDHVEKAKRKKRQLTSMKITKKCDERDRNKDSSEIALHSQSTADDFTSLCEVSSDLQLQNGHPPGAEKLGGNKECPSAPIRPTRNVAVDVEATRFRDLPGNSPSRSTSRNIDPQKRSGGGTAVSDPFHVALALLHTLFLHGQMASINCKSKNAENGIVVKYRERLTHINAAYMKGSIGYGRLFPTKTSSTAFSLNKHFARFVEEFGRNENMRFFCILTNGYLALNGDDIIKGSHVKVLSVDIAKKKYKVLRNCSFIKSSGICQFAVQEEETKQNLLRLLEFPQSLSNDISSAEQEQLKLEFLKKLLIACRQPIKRELIDLIKTDIDQSEVPYSYIELQEVTLRWLESFDRGDMTKELIENMLSDIRNNRSSGRKFRKNIEEEIRCARGIANNCNQAVFDDFLEFLVEGEGKECLKILRKQGLKPRCMSSILNNATNPKEGFLSLFRLWFDERGETTKYLKSLQNGRISLSSMTSVLRGSGVLSSLTFKELHDLWFDESGEKSQYLQNLERGNIPLTNITTIIAGAGVEASRAFKEMHDLLFDANGTASRYLESVERAGIRFSNISTIIKSSGRNGMNAFKALHNAWFDMNGNKSNYLRTLENNGIDLTRFSCMLSGSGLEASTAFEQLYSLLFDCNGHKTEYMNTLDTHEIPLHIVSSILAGSNINAVKAFKKLFYVWFKAGQKTRLLINLELNGIRLTNMSSILSGANIRAAEAFVDLYNEWIDENGEKSQRLKDFTEADDGNCFELSNLSNILNHSGARAKIAFQKLHSVCYDTFETRPSNRFNDMVSAGFRPSYIASLLSQSTTRDASSKLKAFYDVCFDEDGRVTPNLNDFYRAGFTTNDICNALTSSALKTLKEFHDLCFKRDRTKQYLSHFLNSGITPSHICDVLHGSKLKVCSAFEELHNACFQESGIATQLLSGFNESGFTFTHLCQILLKTGNNAAAILKKLYNLCFDETGRKTSYFSNLLETHSHSQVIILLKSKIRRN